MLSPMTCCTGRPGLAPATGLPDDERAAVARHLRELDRLGEDLDVLDRDIAQAAINDPVVKRLLARLHQREPDRCCSAWSPRSATCAGSPGSEKLVSYVGLNPRVRQSGLGLAQHGRISKQGRSHARAMLVEASGGIRSPGPLLVLSAHPSAAWSSGGGRRSGARLGRVVLALADQGGQLSVGAAGPGGEQDTRDGTARQVQPARKGNKRGSTFTT